MSYSITGAINAGIFTAILTLLALYFVVIVVRSFQLNPVLFLGALLRLRGGPVLYLGGLLAFGLVSVAFAMAHAGVYQGLDIRTGVLEWGLLFGVAHWAVDGFLLAALARAHPWVRSGEIDNPGFFVLQYPASNALGFLGVHLLYGYFVSAFYDALR